MIYAIPLVVAGLWLLFAFGPMRARTFATARAGSTLACGLGAVATATAWLASGPTIVSEEILVGSRWQFALSAHGFVGLAPVLIAAIGVVAIAMSDSLSHSTATLRRILCLLAVAMAFVAVREPLVLAVLWTLSPWIAWSELRERFGGRGVAQLFAVYHGVSVACFVGGVSSSQLGWAAASPLLFLVSIVLREAEVPVHSWFPRFVEKAPLGLVVAFTAPQLGVFAQLEILGDSLPADLARLIPMLGAVTAIVAAALGVVQISARRALAFLLMSQMALVSLGLDGTSEVARAGSLLAWLVLSLATTGFAMTISALEARRGELTLATHSGYFSRTPRMAAGFMLMGLASVGFPMTLGFIAEDLIVQGAIESNPAWAFVLIGATALNGMNVMRAFFRLFAGSRIHTGETDLSGRESYALTLVLLTLLIGGIAPNWLLAREFGRTTERVSELHTPAHPDRSP